MNRDELFNVLALILLILPFVDWSAVVILLRAVLKTGEKVLLERLALAIGIAALTTLFGVLAWSRFGHIAIDSTLVGVLLTVIAIFLSAINLVLILRYWRAAL